MHLIGQGCKKLKLSELKKPKLNPEYNKKYKLDNSLPSHPATIYKQCGWISWSSFLNKI